MIWNRWCISVLQYWTSHLLWLRPWNTVVQCMAVCMYFKFCYPNLALEQFGNTAALWKHHNMLLCVFSKKQKSYWETCFIFYKALERSSTLLSAWSKVLQHITTRLLLRAKGFFSEERNQHISYSGRQSGMARWHKN